MKNIFIMVLVVALIAGFCIPAISSEKSFTADKQKVDEKCGFTVKQDVNGKFWFVDPQGRNFLSIGINNITPSAWNPRPNTDYYDAAKTVFGGDYTKWKDDVSRILNKNGFNTLGAWSDPGLYDNQVYGTICLYVTGYSNERCFDGFKPDFEQNVLENARQMLSKYKNTENVIGFFLDNEMPWYGRNGWEDVPNYTMLEAAIELPVSHPAHQAAKQFLKSRYPAESSFNEAWGGNLNSWDDVNIGTLRRCLNEKTQKDRAEFTYLAAEKFFAPACRVVRQLAPGKLILGVRFAGHGAPAGAIEACGKYCDVVSFNNYQILPKADERMLASYYILSGRKPLMVTEYSWRARENTSGNPNSGGAGAVVETQAQRAESYKTYVGSMLSYPMVIGAHWFEFADQSPQGRFDGENSNYGVVDIKHRPYTELLVAMAQTNVMLSKIHAESGINAFKSLPEQTKVIFEPAQHPERPPTLNLLKCEFVRGPELFCAPDANVSLKQQPNALTIEYNTGGDWGCGVLFFGPKMYSLSRGPSFATDLSGYSALEIDACVPKGVSFEAVADEAGVAESTSFNYNTEAGDDGESFAFKTTSGTGKRETIRFNFNELTIRKTWGNQRGARRFDLNAMKGFGLYVHGGQSRGQIDLYSFCLVR
ncbi:MAG: beta-galactosidase [Sedimentisphaerales bacterium]